MLTRFKRWYGGDNNTLPAFIRLVEVRSDGKATAWAKYRVLTRHPAFYAAIIIQQIERWSRNHGR